MLQDQLTKYIFSSSISGLCHDSSFHTSTAHHAIHMSSHFLMIATQMGIGNDFFLFQSVYKLWSKCGTVMGSACGLQNNI